MFKDMSIVVCVGIGVFVVLLMLGVKESDDKELNNLDETISEEKKKLAALKKAAKEKKTIVKDPDPNPDPDPEPDPDPDPDPEKG